MESNPEVQALVWVSVFTAMMWMPYVLERMANLGTWGAFVYPAGPDGGEPKDPAVWADRAKRAHQNAVENLVVFAALVVAVELTGGGDGSTAAAGWAYLGARVAHWVLYVAGIPVARTLAFFAGWCASLVLAAYVVL